MLTRNSRYGWLAITGLLGAVVLIIGLKIHLGTRAQAQPPIAPLPSPETAKSEKAAVPVPLPVVEPSLPDVSRDIASPAPAKMSPATPSDPAPVMPAEIRPVKAEEIRSVVPPAPGTPALGSEARPITIPPSGGSVLPAVSPPAVTPPAVTPPTVPPSPEVPSPSVRAPEPLPTPSVPPPSPELPKVEHHSRGTEPPTVPTPGHVMSYRIRTAGETFKSLAKKTLGTQDRWNDIYKLNPLLKPDVQITVGTVISLPGDACVLDDAEVVRALPSLRPRAPAKPKAVLPLTGTYPVTLDERKVMTLPRAIVEQLGSCDTVLLSPGSDKCLWLTNQAHLDRLQSKLDKSPARETDVRDFKRLYYAQTVKVPLKDGKVHLSDKLTHFAALGAELVLVGIDDHFEIWDAAKWRKFTNAKNRLVAEE
jgi:MraZ protein